LSAASRRSRRRATITAQLDVAGGVKALLEQLEMIKAFKRGEYSEEEG
jgi:hypothetical protein